MFRVVVLALLGNDISYIIIRIIVIFSLKSMFKLFSYCSSYYCLLTLLLSIVASTAAFAPIGRNVRSSSLKVRLQYYSCSEFFF